MSEGNNENANSTFAAAADGKDGKMFIGNILISIR